MRKKVATILGFLIAVALIFSLAAAHVRPNERDILSLFGLTFPYIYFIAIVLLPFLWSANKITFIGLTIIVLWGTPGIFSYVKPVFRERQAADTDINVLTFNAMMGVKLVDERNLFGEDRQALFNELMNRDPKPDIICVQEVNPIVQEALSEAFDYPYFHQLDKRGTVIISRYPIIEKGLVDFGPKLNSCLWADINVNDQIVRVYSAHFESNRLNQSSYDFLAKEGGYESKEAIRGINDLLRKYPKYATARANQAEQVKKHIKASPYPVILCGDFNDPPMSYTYHTFKEELDDTFMKNGRGWGTTWIGGIPLLRIDYILSSPELNNTSFSCLKSNLSDHYPVKASFDISAKR
ncbi:MAG: endonuclease/exonuclease/phosphatase family metal-dependent hydrolase [Saprospiraceae bacterium]